MTKQSKTLAALTAAVVVCAGTYAGLRIWNAGQAEADAAVHIVAVSEVSALSVSNANGSFSFTKLDGAWQYDGDAAFPASSEELDALAEQLGAVDALRTIDDPESLSAYGLDNPALEFSVRGADGQTAVLLLGNTGDGYCYAKREDAGVIYTVDAALSDDLAALTLLDLAALAGFPALGTDNVSSLAWSSGETVLTLTKTAAETDGAEDLWDVNGAPIPSENDAFDRLFDQLFALEFAACYDYQGAADTLDACGLTEPAGTLTVHYRESDSFTLTLGTLDASGENYYAQLSGDPAVYLLPASSIDAITGLTAEALTAAEGAA